MPLVGIIAKKRDVLAIKRELPNCNIDIIEITKDSIKNIKNVVLDDLIILEDIKLEVNEYQYMNELISKIKYLIVNSDINIQCLNNVKIEKPIKVITFGFNTKATITISSVKDEKIIVCLQRDIEKHNNEIIEIQEKEIQIDRVSNKKVYNKLIKFIIKELHNL